MTNKSDFIIKSICKFIQDITTLEGIILKLCPDAYVGTISVNGNKSTAELYFSLKQRKKIYNENSGKLKKSESISYKNENIVIILESPHIKEYEDSDFIHPAIGKTGTKLQTHFEKLLNKSIPNKSEVYNVYIINAIQYPTSLFFNPINKSIRNKVFKFLWNECSYTKNNFKKRLTELNPTILINACTGGKDKYGLRTLVENSIKEQLKTGNLNKNIKYYTSLHPSAPNFSTQTSFEFVTS